MAKNVTALNANVVMVVDELFPQGVRLEQFSTDAAVSQGDDTYAETRMGVDGQMVTGVIDQIKTVTITLEPSSPSIQYFKTLAKAIRTNKKHYPITLLVNLPATGETFTYSNGALKTGKLLPDVNQTLQPIAYTIDFEKVV